MLTSLVPRKSGKVLVLVNGAVWSARENASSISPQRKYGRAPDRRRTRRRT